MADDSDDDLLTLDVLAECRKGYKESHRIMNEQRAAKAAAEKAKKEAEAKAKKEAAAEAAAEKARTPLHDVSNTKQEDEGVKKTGRTPRVRATAPPPSPPTPQQTVKPEPEPVEEEEDLDAMDVDDSKVAAAGEDVQESDPTFAYYSPKKLKIGKPHPGRTVETSVMARAVPPDVRYRLHSGMNSLIESGRLSSLQLESIVYASQQHEFTRVNGGMVGGFFVGDGAGVGKGRTIAGLIYENWLRGRRRHMWFSTSNDLYHAAIKDFSDLGSGPGAIPTKLLSSVKNERDALKNFDEGVLFITYATSVGQSKSGAFRVDQLIEWCGGDDFNGCCVFDEGHKAKKLVPEKSDVKKRGKEKSSKTALSIAEIQDRLPNARVVYVSATGASSLENMAYMSRLGIWGFDNMSLFENLSDFLERDSLRKSTGALELIAMNLKTAGKYVARTLSFADTTFKIMQTETSEDFCLTYNACTEIWYQVLEVMDQAETDLLTGQASYSDPLIDANKVCALFRNQYWGASLRFFKHLCIAAKLPFVRKLAEEAIKDGKCVVIGLLSTGEAATLRWIKKQRGNAFDDDEDDFEEGDDDFVGIESTLRELIKKFVPDRGFSTRDGRRIDYAERREELLEQVSALELPQFPLDDLIDSLGGPDCVAEISGRKVRLEKEPDGDYRQVKRAEAFGCAQKDVNRLETAAFMRGDKLIAIISDAGSTGISLHADKRAKNRRRRVHITIELPYSSTQLVQQLGRSHRSNQASGPEYIAVISDLPGEVRFAATASQRLAQLGAITQGDRSACIGAQDLKEYDLDNKFGRQALEIFARFVLGEEYIEDHYLPASVLADPNGRQRFQTLLKENLALIDLAKPLTKDANRANRRRRRGEDDAEAGGRARNAAVGKLSNVRVSQFFNRLLALKVDLQHEVFGLFENIHHQVVSDAKAQGKHDSGVQDLYAEKIQSCHNTELLRVEGVPVILHEISWDRGVSWEAALERKKQWIEATAEAMQMQNDGEEEEPDVFDDAGTGTGFYRNKHFKMIVVMALEVKESTFLNGKRRRYRHNPRYKIIAPNTGERGHTGAYFLKPRIITGRDLHLDYIKDNKLDAVKKDWDLHYNKSANECIHFTRGEKPGFVYDAQGRRQERFGSKDCFCNPHHYAYTANSPWCPMGRRFGKSFILSGSIIKVWPAIEDVVATKDTHIQLVRASVEDTRIVGIDVRSQQRSTLLEVMGRLKAEWREAEDAYHRAATNPPDMFCPQPVKQDPEAGLLAVKPEMGQPAPGVKPEPMDEEEDRKPAALVFPAAVGGGAGPAYGAPAIVNGIPRPLGLAPEPQLSSQAERMRRLRHGLSARPATAQAPPARDENSLMGGAGAGALRGITLPGHKKAKAPKRRRVSAASQARAALLQRLYAQIMAPPPDIPVQIAQPAARAAPRPFASLPYDPNSGSDS